MLVVISKFSCHNYINFIIKPVYIGYLLLDSFKFMIKLSSSYYTEHIRSVLVTSVQVIMAILLRMFLIHIAQAILQKNVLMFLNAFFFYFFVKLTISAEEKILKQNS